MHGEEQLWIADAMSKNWVSTVGENINEIERQVAEKVGRKYAVALSTGTAALHLAIRLAGERRAAGEIVELSPSEESRDEATRRQKAKGYRELVYVE